MRAFLVAVLALFAAPTDHARAETTNEILIVDASDVPSGVLHARLHVPLRAGAAIDRLAEATDLARESIRELSPREPATAFIAIALEPLALCLALGGDVTRAAALEGYADAALRAQGFEREFTETTSHERLMALLAERLDADELARRLADGAALQPEAAIALALAEP